MVLPLTQVDYRPSPSQSPSLLISGSGSWSQREGRAPALSLAFAAKNVKNLPLVLRAREKFELDL